MRILKRFLAIALCAALCVPIAPAQDRQGDARIAQDVTIIIQQQQVRFIAQKAGEEMHLQVFDQTGELVYDSGATVNAELIWPLRNGSGEALKSGLYAYSLSIKEAGKEIGAETARVRRGHFIVDRAKDRDGNADKLWVTSQGEGDVGAELTMARDQNAAIAGTAISGGSSERTVGQRAEIAGRDEAGRTIDADTQSQSKPGKGADKAAAAAVAAGTIGQIAKFITATEIGNSAITETGSNIGIGVIPAPGYRLDVSGAMHVTTAPNTNNGEIAFATPNSETGMTIVRDSGRADVRFDGSTLKLAAGPVGGPPGPAVVINTTGNVGMGITPPSGSGYRLDVSGAMHVTTAPTANNGEIAFSTPNAETGMTIVRESGRADVRFDGSALKLVAGVVGGPPGPTEGVLITTTGRVGIGTVNPATKLHVEGGGIVETAIKSGNERAILSLGNGLGPSNYVWTLESGVGGRFPSLFGIYNRTVNKSGLEIDGNLLVYVKALQITGGADFAENFDVQAPHNSTGSGATEIQPGMVVAIDPINPGKLNLSRRAYDRRVAGIISGAGDVKPGMMMRQEGTLADGKHPVALSGRVYAWGDAAHGAIRPGDLLTTSATPGHAMKAGNPAKAQGAIIGKAMTGLKAGKGLVLVLVTLQ